MKNLICLILGVLICTPLIAQKKDSLPKQQKGNEMQTLFGGKKFSHGFYFSPTVHYGQIDNSDMFSVGLRGGWVINHRFVLGLAGEGFVTQHSLDRTIFGANDTADARFEGGYGGLLLEPILFSNILVHITFPIIVGAGGATWVSNDKLHQQMHSDNQNQDFEGMTLDHSAFFVCEPGVQLELNVFKFMRLAGGVSYRYTAGLDLIGTDKKFLNNVNYSLGLKFGIF